MKRVYSSFDRIAVHHARNLLEAHGIEAEVRNEILGSALGELPPAECQFELWVARDADGDEAERVLRPGAPDASAGAPAWLCAGCSETCEPQFAQCWRWGRLREG